jgi:hypothetical protein
MWRFFFRMARKLGLFKRRRKTKNTFKPADPPQGFKVVEK